MLSMDAGRREHGTRRVFVGFRFKARLPVLHPHSDDPEIIDSDSYCHFNMHMEGTVNNTCAAGMLRIAKSWACCEVHLPMDKRYTDAHPKCAARLSRRN
jgi:hypothetical protein